MSFGGAREHLGLLAASCACALAFSLGSSASRGAVVLLGNDPFLQSYFGNSHARQARAAGGKSSWKETLNKLKGMHAREKKVREEKSEQEFATDWGKAQPGAAHKKVKAVHSRGAPSNTRSAFDSMEAMVSSHMKETQDLEDEKVKGIGMGGDVDVKALRHHGAPQAHAREHEVKLASKESRVKYHSAMPEFNSHVRDLEKSLGETANPPAGPVHFKGQKESVKYNTQFMSADGKVGSQLSNLSKELSAEKEAAELSEHQAKAKAAKAWNSGAKRAMQVEDAYSRPMQDITASVRQPEADVVRTFA